MKKTINVKTKMAFQPQSLIKNIDYYCFCSNRLTKIEKSIKKSNKFDKNKFSYNFSTNLASKKQMSGQSLSQTSC